MAGQWSHQDAPHVDRLSSPTSVGAVCGALVPGSPTSRPRTGTNPWAVGSRAAQQEAGERSAQCWRHPSAPPQVPTHRVPQEPRTRGHRGWGPLP